MRMLLVDDDSNVRDVVRRVLARQFETLEIVECKDGVEALEQLSRYEHDVMLLDVSMPLMDGIDVLQSVRRSPHLAKMPVIMMTGHNEEDVIRRALKIGVNDFILKPIRPAQLCERVFKVLTRSTSGDDRKGHPRHVFRPLTLTEATPVLLADGNEEFRQFFRNAMSSLCTVHDVASGLAAFQHCLEQPPYALFVGSELGIVSGEALTRKLGALPRLCGIRVVGIATERTLLQVRKRGVFEAVVTRSFVRDVFMEGIQSLLRKPASTAREIVGVPDLKLLAISAAEESLSASLGQPVVLRPQSDRLAQPTGAAVTLRVGADRTPLLIRLTAPAQGMARLAAKLDKVVDTTSAEMTSLALIALVRHLAETIAEELRDRRLPVTSEPPAAMRTLARKQSPASTDQGLSLEFDVPGEKMSMRVSLAVGAGDAAAGPAVPGRD